MEISQFLLSLGLSEAQIAPEERTTILHDLAVQGDVQAVDWLCSHGLDVNGVDSNGRTPLHYAAMRNNVGMIETLLRHGASINALDEDMTTPLYYAVATSKPDVIAFLLDNGADANATEGGKGLMLSTALHYGHRFAAIAVLEHSSGDTGLSERGVSDLHVAAAMGECDEVCQLLQDWADVDQQDEYGFTPLHFAADNGSVDVLRALIDAHADPNKADSTGWTPLHHASRRGNEAAVRFLIERGADPNSIAWQHVTPLNLAVRIGEQSLIECLLEAGATNEPDDCGWTPLLEAAWSDKVDLVRPMLAHGIQILSDDLFRLSSHQATVVEALDGLDDAEIDECLSEISLEQYNALLHTAARTNSANLTRWLIDHGADVNFLSGGSYSCAPLHVAVANKALSVVIELLRSGADASIVDSNQRTPYDISTESSSNEEIQAVLTEAGMAARLL